MKPNCSTRRKVIGCPAAALVAVAAAAEPSDAIQLMVLLFTIRRSRSPRQILNWNFLIQQASRFENLPGVYRVAVVDLQVHHQPLHLRKVALAVGGLQA